jgi:hypothetical protein
MSEVSPRFGFTAISYAIWRMVVKERIMATLAPRHEAVMTLPRICRARCTCAPRQDGWLS